MQSDRPHSLQSRPHSSTIVRYDCKCQEDALVNGFDINDYRWLDNQAKCMGRDWLADGKVGFVKD
jgi:hypothetical protein